MQNLLLEISKRFAPKMEEQYHKEFVRVAEDFIVIAIQKRNARPGNGHYMNDNKDITQ